jgi:pyruvate formate lyase activating enzyme
MPSTKEHYHRQALRGQRPSTLATGAGRMGRGGKNLAPAHGFNRHMSGIVSDIQRFSVHDGPGIRTTVFLKGCQMRCRWCHNPEALRPGPELQLFLDKCIGCGTCFKVCPRGAHGMESGRRVFHRQRCTACGTCARSCYAEALVLVGRQMTAAEVLAEAVQDREFYADSDGGVTISGGEPIFQPAFAREILALCREAGIHTAIETNLAWPWEQVESVLGVTDLVMADIKMMDPAAHRQWTGVTNDMILDNVQRLGRAGRPLVIRTPVIPGVNDTASEIGRVGSLLAGLANLLYYELLPHNPLAAGKYESLGMEQDEFSAPRGVSDKMNALAAEAGKSGVPVRVAGTKG